MATILWSVLNVVLMLALLFTFIQAARLLKQRFGLATALFFGLGLLFLAGRGTSQPAISNSNLLGEVPPHTPPASHSATQSTPLGGNLKLTLLAEYNQTADGVKARGLYPVVSGFVLGHRWLPLGGSAVQSGQQLRCIAVLQHQWLLLGIPVFSQTQEYTNSMALATL